MEIESIWKLVLFGICHWMLAGLLLQDLAARKRVVGGRKGLWGLLIVLFTYFGSLLYLSFHPQVLTQSYCQRGLYHEQKEDYDCR